MEIEMELQFWITFLVVLVTGAVICLLLYLRRNDDYWKDKGIPHIPAVSLFSLLKGFGKQPLHEAMVDVYKKYGRLFGTVLFSVPGITVADPDLLRDILVKDFHVFSTRRDMKIEDSIMGKMVSILNGEDWKRVRTVITPAFTSRKMRKMTSVVKNCSETVVGAIKDHIDKGIPFDCRKVFGAFTMDVIASSAFATKIDSHNDPNNEFVVHAKRSFSRQALLRMLVVIFVPSYILKLIRFNPADEKVMNFFRSVTLQLIEERKKRGQKGNDFLQMMIDASEEVLEGEKKSAGFKTLDLKDEEEDHYGRIDGNSKITYTTKRLSQDEIIAQCILFFVVGYETTAATLSFISYNLALNPECQDKLIREVDEAFDRNGELNYDVIRNMKYLDCVVSETLRIYPPVIVSERTATEDYVLGNTGITIPKGMTVQFPIHAMHHDPEFFPEPEKFDPERFLGENRHNHHPYSYLPFGAGPRNCLGMRFALLEIKLCISTILRHYRLRTAPETKVPLEFAMNQGFLTTNELPLIAEKRNDLKTM